MEEDKKKKKTRKKKNKQATKQTESVTIDAGESTSDRQSHGPEIGQNNNRLSRIIDAPNDGGGHINADRDGLLANGTEGTSTAEAEKRCRLDREASYQEKIKELKAEKDAQRQKEVFLEERIKQLLKERDENSQKEASREGRIKQLQDEKNASMQNEAATLKEKLMQLEKEKEALIQKEVSLEQKIQQLQREINAHLQKEASLKAEILQLKGEKDSWVQKEAGFEQKINQLVDEAALLNLKGVGLQEKIKQMERERDSWILKENLAKESIACLTTDNTNLQAQVIELEQSRKNLLEDKQQLIGNISSLQLQIDNLKGAAGLSHSSMDNKVISEDGDVNYQVEAARALVEKLITENSELVEKVNELYAEIDRRGVRTEYVSSAGSVPGAVTAPSANIADGAALMPDLAVGADDGQRTAQATNSIPEASRMVSISDSTHSLEDVTVEDQRNGEHVNVNDGPRLANTSEIIEADEIVQIPLDENEVREINLAVAQNNEKTDVPLTDAPLIGAPFRLMSFVARYVSGADLVNKNTGKSG